jgi:enterochelin esterase-like enzyme
VDLTSSVLLTLALLVTLAAGVAVVVFWARFAAPDPLRVAARAGLLVGVNLLVLATIGLVANDTFGFFADWTDLAGAFTSTPQIVATARGGAAAAAAAAHVPGEALPSPTGPLPALPTGSRQQSFTVSGPASHLTGRVVVLLPADYFQPSQRGQRYPVIETFHGYPGTPEQWLNRMALGQAVDAEVAAHRMSPPIIVAPQLEIPPGRDTECVNGGPALPAVETWVTTDVPNWVARTFRVKLDRASWATAGLSAGGWCAAMAALMHPARYGAAMVFGGYFSPYFGAQYRPFPPTSPQGQRYDLVGLTKRSPPPVAVWMETSHSDRTSYRSSARFLAAVRPPLSVNLVEFAHAGHSVLLWAGLVPQALGWLESQVPGFRPQAAGRPAQPGPAPTRPHTLTVVIPRRGGGMNCPGVSGDSLVCDLSRRLEVDVERSGRPRVRRVGCLRSTRRGGGG